jgi:hypothetical protein
MWRRKKVILIALLAGIVLFASTAGIVLAQTGDEDDSQPKTLMCRVAEILGIEEQELEDAFTQARSEMEAAALDTYLQDLVDQGKITEEEAKQYKEWWQARPDMAPFQQQLREWQQARPDITLPGPQGGSGDFGFRGGMRGGCGFRGW